MDASTDGLNERFRLAIRGRHRSFRTARFSLAESARHCCLLGLIFLAKILNRLVVLDSMAGSTVYTRNARTERGLWRSFRTERKRDLRHRAGAGRRSLPTSLDRVEYPEEHYRWIKFRLTLVPFAVPTTVESAGKPIAFNSANAGSWVRAQPCHRRRSGRLRSLPVLPACDDKISRRP